MRFRFLFVCVSLFVLVCCFFMEPAGVYAQSRASLNDALMLMNRKQYEEAYIRLQPFIESDHINPDAFSVAVTCLTHLKKYDKAIAIIRDSLGGSYNNLPVSVQLGALYHVKGDTSMALEIWRKTLAANRSNMQAYREIAMTMRDNGEYAPAIAILHQARKRFRNHLLFISEITDIYLQAGQNRQAVSGFLQILKTNPRELPLMEALLERLGDATLYSAADQAIHDAINQASSHNAYTVALHELLIWVNLQNNDYRQAYNNALALQKENSGDDPLFEIAVQLANAGEFDLAHQAYQWYIDHPEPVTTPRSMEQLALLDIRQASFSSVNMLSPYAHIDSLYRHALGRLQGLAKQYPDYSGMPDLLLELGELSLDYNHDAAAAEQVLARMNAELRADNLRAQIDFLRGRIDLFNGNFDRARISLTRSRETTQSDSLKNKARFYLALNDFYAGDFTYASRQIQSLEQNPGSDYANNALRLKQWLQDGMIGDSVTEQLSKYARARYLSSRGENQKAFNLLLPDVLASGSMPLEDQMALLSSRLLQENNNPVISLLITDWYLQRHPGGTLYESLLWQRARLADQLHGTETDSLLLQRFVSHLPSGNKSIFNNAVNLSEETIRLKNITKDTGRIIALYEQVLNHFPRGFYAEFCRRRIRHLQDGLQS